MTTSHREYIAKHGRPSDELVQEIVRRIVEVADPDRIILFGSGARGDMGKHSDLDFLIIKSGEYSRRGLTGKVYRRMLGVDILLTLSCLPQRASRGTRTSSQ